jgi:uncharacterized damage-inducible protein DinB
MPVRLLFEIETNNYPEEDRMDIPEMYDYLIRARRDLWSTLEGLSDEVLSRPLMKGERFRCIKDLVFHTAAVEDGWLHYTILSDEPVETAFPALKGTEDASSIELKLLLDYWRSVEQSTLTYLGTLTDEELNRLVDDSPTERYKLDGLLWHVMIHEMRHTAQICVLLRTQGIKPPSLDLLFYLPSQ